MKKKQEQLKIKEKKQVDVLKNLRPTTQELTNKNMIPEGKLNEEDKNELNKIKETEKNCRQTKINL